MIGILHLINPSIRSVQSIVLYPRKGLISEYVETFSKYNPNNQISITRCVGGEHIDKKKLKSSQVLVCTPGKLKSYLEGNYVNFEHLKIVVFDIANHLFMTELQPQSQMILNLLPSSKTFWFLSPVFDECSLAEFARKKPEGRIIEIEDNRVLKQVKFYFKYYETQEDTFEYLCSKCEDNDKKIVIFSCDLNELNQTYTALKRFSPLKLDDSMSLDEQLHARDLFFTGNHQVIVVHGVYHLIRKVICRLNVQVYCLDRVDSKMFVGRARRGTFQSGDELVLFCQASEDEYISKLALELGIDIYLIRVQ